MTESSEFSAQTGGARGKRSVRWRPIAAAVTVLSAIAVPSAILASNSGAASVTPASTSVTTALSGAGAAGGLLTVPAGTAVTDSAVLAGPNASRATGSVTYNIYSSSACNASVSVVAGTPEPITTPGTLPNSPPETLSPGPTGIYYWQAVYSGDSANATSSSPCGSAFLPNEEEKVTPQVYTGAAYDLGLTASVLGSINLGPITVNPAGPVSTSSSSSTAAPCVLNPIVASVLISGVLCAGVTTDATAFQSSANASVANAAVGLPLLPAISVQAVASTSQTSCAGSSGTTTIAYLKIGSTVVISKPTAIAPNTTLTVGPASVVLNQQIPVTGPDTGLTVNAISVSVSLPGLASLHLVVASSESDIGNCAGVIRNPSLP